MKFIYKIEVLPRDNQSYRVATDIEGRLSLMSKNGDMLFDVDGILLIELAIFFKKWLDKEEFKDFYYASMDFEEEPILAFKFGTDNLYSFVSVWQKSSADDLLLADIQSSMANYIEALQAELKMSHGIDIESYEGFQ